MNKFLPALGASMVVHAAIAATMAGLTARRQAQGQIALQVAVVEKPAPPPPKAEPPKPPKIVPMKKMARAPRQELPPPTIIPPKTDAPPPPTQEAKDVTPAPVIVTG